MSEIDIHQCPDQRPGVQVVYSRGIQHGRWTWQLVVTREATQSDLEANHYLEEEGEIIWSMAVEINHCPYCGGRLRDEPLGTIEFALSDSSGWKTKVL